MTEHTLYECNTPTCQLGGVGQPGYFTGGMTVESMTQITGTPAESGVEGEDFGDGVCPNCGRPGVEVGTHESVEATDG